MYNNTVIMVLDIETRSDVDLPKCGAYKYFESQYTDVYLASSWFSDDQDTLVNWHTGEPCPLKVRHHIETGGLVFSHNAEFEWLGVNKVLAPKHGWPRVKLSQMRCTATMARAHGLPGSLERAAQCLDIESRKDASGYQLMMQMCQPGEYTHANEPVFHPITPEKREQLTHYCERDVLLTAAVLSRLCYWSDYQQHAWEAAIQINERGVMLDRAYVYWARQGAKEAKEKGDRLIHAYTLGELDSTNQTVALKAWINNNSDLSLPNVNQTTLEAVEEQDVSPHVWQVIQARLSGRAAAVGKYQAALYGISEDNRFHGAFLPFGAATTGRFSSRRLQLHNLRRDTSDDGGFRALRSALAHCDWSDIELEDLARNVRRMVIAKPGNRLIKADWSQIEARIAPWLALDLDISAEELLQAFDRGEDIYKYQAAGMFNQPIEGIDKRLRFLGKVAQLSLGYQGGWRALNNMAVGNGAEPFSEGEGRHLVDLWREQNPWARYAWNELELAALSTMATSIAITACRCVFYKPPKVPFLTCRLPSGRYLCYPDPKIATDTYGEPAITYRKAAVVPKKDEKDWPRTQLYGGKLLENITQAVAADVLMSALVTCDRLELPVVAHVHDEIVMEVSADHAKALAQVLLEIMCTELPWAKGLPLNADVQILERYK